MFASPLYYQRMVDDTWCYAMQGQPATVAYPPGVSQQTHTLGTKITPGHPSYPPGPVPGTLGPNKKKRSSALEHIGPFWA